MVSMWGTVGEGLGSRSWTGSDFIVYLMESQEIKLVGGTWDKTRKAVLALLFEGREVVSIAK